MCINFITDATAALEPGQHTYRHSDVSMLDVVGGDALSAVPNGDGDNLLNELRELLPCDDTATLGLDPLAFDELQMLTDSNLISDPYIENSLRRDCNFNNYRVL
jgi:Transducer of regulated CREB activity, C terminus